MKKLFIAFSAVLIVVVSSSVATWAMPGAAPTAGYSSSNGQLVEVAGAGWQGPSEFKAVGITLAAWPKTPPASSNGCKAKRGNKSNQRADYQALCRPARVA